MTRIALYEAEPDAGHEGVLYRALRDDAGFRFVSVGEGEGYEVIREEGTPDVDGGVALIDLFEVPDGEDEAFLAGWDGARAGLAQQRGYLGARLHRAIGPADYRFVDVVRWSSPLMVARAAAKIPLPSHPALYQAV